MFIYFDFEFRNNGKAEEIILLSYMTSINKTPKLIDLRASTAAAQILQLVEKFKSFVWVAFNAQADLTCLLSFNVDISQLKVIDVMVETKMISLTHEQYFGQKHDLLTTAYRFGIGSVCSRGFKDDTRNIILQNVSYTPQQWSTIRAYGPVDIEPLPKLLNKVWEVHSNKDSCITLEEMIDRGEYVKAVTKLAHKTRGFDVDKALLHGIFANRTDFIRQLQIHVNSNYGELYVGKDFNEPMVWSHKAFTALVERRGYEWKATPSGNQLVVSASYFKEKSRQYSELTPLYHTRKTIDAMRSTDLRELERNGCSKPVSLIFNQKTGRNSPKPSQGFLLNLPPWMRSLIKPRRGNLLIGIDWEQQEIAIAAALSGDERYMQAYNAEDGDVYLTLAKMAGAVPTDATKSTHSIERQTFKAVQLGLGYGKGLRSLASDVYAANRDENGSFLLSLSEAEDKAESILTWHQQTFFEYWDWVNDTVARARIDGYLKSLDGWTYFVDSRVKNTQLLNFPMQANGAAMMRKAVVNAASKDSFDLVCTLHDALYANSTVSNEKQVISEMTTCMNEACQELLGNSVLIRTDVSIYDSETGYQDVRGKEMLGQIKNYLSNKS